MAEYLSAALQDDGFRRKLEAEDHIDRAFQAKEQQFLQSEKRRAEAEKREMEERRQKEEERKKREAAEEREKAAETKLKTAIKNTHQRGFSIEEIAESFGLEVVFVEKVVSGNDYLSLLSH